jgi:hypothetical protein
MAEKSRLKGTRYPIIPCVLTSRLHVNIIPTMSKALQMSRRQFWKGKSERDGIRIENIGNRPVDGDQIRLTTAMERSEVLIAAAIEHDSRLARRSQWRRSEEGEHVCAELLAEGDDQPFYKRTRNVINDATTAGEPIRVVISTDDKEVPPGTAAAFIATARLVQQFMPLEIWWQGAWLSEDRYKGFVSLVPLVKGDMDFSRLEFCIADQQRDMFSFLVMASHAVLELHEVWTGCGHRAQEHYLRQDRDRLKAHFISHTGIRPDPESIAAHAALWLGWNSVYDTKWMLEQNESWAAQSLPPIPVKYVDKRTPAEIEREDREMREWRQRERQRESTIAETRFAGPME